MDRYAPGTLLTGTCGWTDTTLRSCHRFFPASVKTAVDALQHYSRFFGVVEIDTATYAIPRQAQIREWMGVVPKGFLFACKIFGLFTSRSIGVTALPRDLRTAHLDLDAEAAGSSSSGGGGGGPDGAATIALADMPPALVDALWQRQNDALAVLHDAGRLAVVVFQFHTNFTPSVEHFAYIAECRRRLDARYIMAIEFRSRAWFAEGSAAVAPVATSAAGDGSTSSGSSSSSSTAATGGVGVIVCPEAVYAAVPQAAAAAAPAADAGASDSASAGTATSAAAAAAAALAGVDPLRPASFPTQRAATCYFLRRCGIVNAPSDDLQVEMPVHPGPQSAYKDGRAWICDDLTSPACAYIRVHRRVGTDRLLSKQELEDWARRMVRMACTAEPATPPFQWQGPSHLCTFDAASLRAGAASSSAAVVAAAPPVDHPWFWSRLRGPIFFMVGTDWEDQPIINLRAMAAAAAAAAAGAADGDSTAAAAASVSGTGASAGTSMQRCPLSVCDWRAIAKQQDDKRGLAAFFAKPSAAHAAGAVSGSPIPAGAASSADVPAPSATGGSALISPARRQPPEATPAAATAAAASPLRPATASPLKALFAATASSAAGGSSSTSGVKRPRSALAGDDAGSGAPASSSDSSSRVAGVHATGGSDDAGAKAGDGSGRSSPLLIDSDSDGDGEKDAGAGSVSSSSSRSGGGAKPAPAGKVASTASGGEAQRSGKAAKGTATGGRAGGPPAAKRAKTGSSAAAAGAPAAAGGGESRTLHAFFARS